MNYSLSATEKIYIESIIKEHESLIIDYIKRHQFDCCFFDRDHVNRKVLRFHSNKTMESCQVNFTIFDQFIEIFEEEIEREYDHPAYCKYFNIQFEGLDSRRWRLGIYYIYICNQILKIFKKYEKGLK